MKKKALLWDFDGVIVDSFDVCYGINKDYYTPDLTVENYKKRFMGNVFDHKEAKNSDYYFSLYTPRVLKKHVVTGVEEIIRTSENIFDSFIISSTATAPITKFLEKNNLLAYFKEILGSDIEKSKAKKISLILQKHRLKPSGCLFITDTVGDILEAKKCEIESIAVTWGWHDKVLLSQAGPLAIADSPDQLQRLIF